MSFYLVNMSAVSLHTAGRTYNIATLFTGIFSVLVVVLVILISPLFLYRLTVTLCMIVVLTSSNQPLVKLNPMSPDRYDSPIYIGYRLRRVTPTCLETEMGRLMVSFANMIVLFCMSFTFISISIFIRVTWHVFSHVVTMCLCLAMAHLYVLELCWCLVGTGQKWLLAQMNT